MIKKSLDVPTASAMLPVRESFGHKGTFGKAILFCGSKNMVGCCVLATIGALRSGAGLVTLAFPDVLYAPLTSRLTENLFLPLASDVDGFFSIAAVDEAVARAEENDVIMVGCGIGTGEGARLLVKSLLALENKSIIIDADGINCLCDLKNELKSSKSEVLLTPHPGEMARLTGKTVSMIENSRDDTITDFCKAYGVNVLLKGHKTLVCNSAVTEIYTNNTGNTGLSKGGSGDLLSGIISGLALAFKGDLYKGAVLGAFVHGMCADILKKQYSEYSILPSDCADVLPVVYSIIENGGAD